MGYPSKGIGKAQPNIGALVERSQALAGDRGKKADDNRAVTREDAANLGMIAIKTKHASAAPTQAEFNTLVDDMRALAAVLNAMGAKFTGL